MLFEGFIFCEENNFRLEENNKKYDECITFNKGIIGSKLIRNSSILSNCYFGCLRSDSSEKETKILSNLDAQNFVSFSLPEYLASANANSIGVGAWYNVDQQQLTLSRDLFGIIPFYYICIPNQLIAFSTSLSSLVTNSRIRRYITINSERISKYASFLNDTATAYSTDTFYNNIKSVPPGHLLTVTFEYTSAKPYILLQPSRWSCLSTVEEFGEEFRSKFSNSVQRSIQGESKVLASHLSGGMDSSSVSAMVKYLYPDLPLYTFYNKSNTIGSNENLYAISVAEKIGSYHNEVLQSEEDFKLLSLYTSLSAQPSSTLLSPSFTGSLMQYAKTYGCDTIFNGIDGDSIAGSGLELLNRLFEQGQWDLVKSLLKKRVAHYSHATQYPKWNSFSYEKKFNIVLQNFLYLRISSKMLQLPLKEFYKFYEEVSRHFDVSYSYFIRRGGKSIFDKLRKRQVTPTTSILYDDLASSNKNVGSDPHLIGLLGDNFLPGHRRSLNDVFNAQAILSGEQNFVLSNHYDIINCSPFYDRELFEVCMSCPDIIKYGEGIGRAHFREAMKGLLPEDVRCRSDKTHIGPNGQEVILRMYNQAESLVMDSSEIWKFVDRQKFDQQIAILKNDRIPYLQKSTTWFNISRTISLATWLEWFKTAKN